MNAYHRRLTAALRGSFALTVSATTRYVDLNCITPSWPYTDWGSAATTIQDAIDVADAGDLILVTNGVYATGERVVSGSLGSRVVVDKAVTVQSANGPADTVIEGYQLPGTTNGNGAVRCVYLTNNAVLIGFTLTNGATRAAGLTTEKRGGGAYCRSSSAVLSNCVLTANAAVDQGGGVYQGTLYNCTLFSNSATNGGGAYFSTLRNCTLTGNRARISGGGAYSGSLSNCVLSSNTATNGGGTYSSALTNCLINGNSAVEGGGANGGTLTGCLVNSNNAASGGGASRSALINCTMRGNTASHDGGGASFGTLANCTLTANSGRFGGGISRSKATNCVLTANSAWEFGGGAYYPQFVSSECVLLGCTLVGNSAVARGGGAFNCLLTNSIIFFNTASVDDNTAYSRLYFCCTTTSPWSGGSNLLVDPQLASMSHLSASSPCRSAGWGGVIGGADVDGEAWAASPSIGCDEFRSGAVTGAVSVAIQPVSTVVAAGAELGFRADILGRLSASRWEFGDGTIISNRPLVAYAWKSLGDYPVVLRAYNETLPNGISATVNVQVVSQPVHFVTQRSTTPVTPYSSWSTAATNIQDAVDAATVPGALVLVSNGVFSTGARRMAGMVSNRLVVAKPLTVRSLNGPSVTTIQGYQVPGVVFSNTAVRCVFLGAGVTFSGMTLSNGATAGVKDAGVSPELDEAGGGFYCAAPNVVISNCVIANNAAYKFGGGGWGGTLTGCLVISNSCARYDGDGGGCYSSVVSNSTFVGNTSQSGYGGAISGGVLNNCALSNNVARSGGGVFGATLNNCLVTGNSGYDGGGTHSSVLFNCLIAGNTGTSGGGANGCIISNCVVTGNFANDGGGVYGGTVLRTEVSQNTATNGGGGGILAALSNCSVSQNQAGTKGGGTYYGSATNCAIVGNRVIYRGTGGGAFGAVLFNCTLTGNSAEVAGGSYDGAMKNCLLYYNQANEQVNWGGMASLDYCCTTPQPTNGAGNFTNAPAMDYNFHLSAGSPCINAGNNTYVTNSTDLDGNPRIVGGTVDIGAYEFQSPASTISYAWAQQFCLPTDGSADFVDTDSDGHNNWQEWRADTVPTNALSRLALLAPTNASTGVAVTWQSVPTRSYFLERGTNMASVPALLTLATNLRSQVGTITFTDTSATNGGPFFYRVGVQP